MDNMLTQVVKKIVKGNKILDLSLVGGVSTVIVVDVERLFGSNKHKIVHLIFNCPIPKINRKVYL